MVKIDPERDYYADLDLPSTAQAAEIKKQFKKLALKWHPDRNRENEEVVKSRFQIINEANEILSDEKTKVKYDETQLKKRQSYPAASGVYGNPWQNAGRGYHPPPQRANMPPRPASHTAHPTARQKYSQFSGRSAPNDNVPENPRGTWKAWKDYRSRDAAKEKPSQSTGQQPYSARDPPPPPRTETQREKANASFGTRRDRGNRTTNFSRNRNRNNGTAEDPYSNPDPSTNANSNGNGTTTNPTPDMAWEPAAATNNYSSSTRHTNIFNMADEGKPDAQDSHSGKTEKPVSYGYDNADPDDSPTSKKQKTTIPNSDGSGSSKANNGNNSAQQEGNRQPKAPPSVYGPSFHYTRTPFQTPRAENTHGSSGPYGGVKKPNAAWTSEIEVEAKQRSVLESIISDRHAASALNTSRQHQQAKVGPSAGSMPSSHASGSHSPPTTANNPMHASFSFPVDDNTFQPTGSGASSMHANVSVEDLNFAEVNGGQTWNFTGPPPSGAGGPSTTPGAGKTRASTRPGRKSPLKKQRSQRSRMSPMSPQHAEKADDIPSPYRQPTKPAQPAQPTQPTQATAPTFDPNAWTQFDHSMFAPQPAVAPSQSPTRGRQGAPGAPKPGAPKKPRFQASVEEEPPAPTNTNGTGVGAASAAGAGPTMPSHFHRADAASAPSPMAMDIDSPPADKSNGPGFPGPAPARPIPVEPARAEWRSGNPVTTNGTTAPPKPAKPSALGTKANPICVPSEDTQEFRASFADLRNTEPFNTQAQGLNSLGDLRSTLPFDSQASTNIPLKRETNVSKLEVPNIRAPKPPTQPNPTYLSGMAGKYKADEWNKYMGKFTLYLEEYTRYDQVIGTYLANARVALSLDGITGKGFAWLDPSKDDTPFRDYEKVLRDTSDVEQLALEAKKQHRDAVMYVRLLREGMKQQ